jgi:hypothetical protein
MTGGERDMTKTSGNVDRRGFLKAGGALGGAGALMATGGFSFSRAFASGGTATDTTLDILNAALTAEQLATTFYYQGVAGPRSSNLGSIHNANNLNYFQAALYQEYQHASIFSSLGATTLAGKDASGTPQFYFPAGSFKNSAAYLGVLDALETAFIGAYLAAIGEWAGDSSPALAQTYGFTGPQLAKIAGQFMGTEAEHRVLGRVTSGANPPNNLILEAAPYTQVGSPTNTNGTAVGALLPFVTGSGFAGGAEGPYSLPTNAQVTAAASPYTNLTNPGIAAP